MDLGRVADEVRRIAGRAGELLVRGQAQGFAVEHKGAVDLVTEHDRRSEALVLDELGRAFPGCAVVGEESGAGQVVDTGQGTFYVDPLDGTTNYAHGLPFYAVSIALQLQGQAVVGVVLAPALGWEFFAVAGGGAFCGGQRLVVSRVTDLGEALVATGFPYDRRTSSLDNVAQLRAVLHRCQGVRRLGSAALDLALVARGRLDAYWEFKINPWDVLAGALLVREAGGQVSAADGGPFDPHGRQILASNGPLHPQLVEALATCGPVPL